MGPLMTAEGNCGSGLDEFSDVASRETAMRGSSSMSGQ